MKCSRIVIRLLALAASHVIFVIAGHAAVLVNEGEPRARIVVAPDAPVATREAAGELADYVQRISGARLPVVEAGGATAAEMPTTLWVGHHENIGELFPGVDLSLTAHEQILIAVRGDHVLVKGKDLVVSNRELQAGTRHAVYTFLQEYLGVRWFWPGDLGEVVPTQSTIELEDSVYAFNPPLKQRHIRFRPSVRELTTRTDWFYPAVREVEGYPHSDPDAVLAIARRLDGEMRTWDRRQRSGFRFMRAGHAFERWREQFGESNPEYFALQPDGSRDPFPRPSYDKLCISNPEVAERWLEQATTQLERNPWQQVVSVSPNDSGFAGKCVCEDCRAWDAKSGPMVTLRWRNLEKEHVALTDRYVRFWNILSDRLRERFPDRDVQLGAWAYGAYRTAPVEVTLRDNIVIGYVGGMGHASPEGRERNLQEWKDWAAMSSNLVWRPNLFFRYDAMPEVPARRLAEDLAFMADHHLVGVDLSTCYQHWATQGLQYYLLAQLAWNPWQDIDELLDDYMLRAFGPAAAPYMREYFQILEDAFYEMQDRKHGINRYQAIVLFPEVYSPQLLSQLHDLIARAKAAAGDSGNGLYRKRIEFKAIGLEFTEAQVDAIDAMTALRTGRGRIEEIVPRAFEATARRDAILHAQLDSFALNAVSPYYQPSKMTSYLGPPDASFRAFIETDDRTHTLPFEWAFKLDPENRGIDDRWYDPDTAERLSWDTLQVTAPWGDQLLTDDPVDPVNLIYHGVAWYRTAFEPPSVGAGERLWLDVGSIDESAWVYLNGRLVAAQDFAELGDRDAWKKPRRYDVTDFIRPGANDVTIRVQALAGQGGITRPAVLRVRPENFVSNGRFVDGRTGWGLRDLEDAQRELEWQAEPGAFVGEPALSVTIAPGERGRMLQVVNRPLEAGRTYELRIRYRQHLDQPGDDPEAVPMRARLIAYPSDGQAHERKDRMWLDSPTHSETDWEYLSGLFEAPRDYRAFRITLFFNQPGRYVIDEVTLH